MTETQQSISAWADEAFGPISSNIRAAVRANEEMAELLKALAQDDESLMASDEIADIVIVLSRLATSLGVDVGQAVESKMKINRARTWAKDGTGHGYHVAPGGAAIVLGGGHGLVGRGRRRAVEEEEG